MTTLVLLTLGGLALLVAGAEALVRGASRLATTWGVSPLVVGLTIVAAGTSTPELLVSTTAAMKGNADIALANIVGSNIFNILFILGVSALIRPLVIHLQYIRKEVPIMIGVTALVWLAGADGGIDRWEGFVGVAAMAAYTFLSYRAARAEGREVQEEFAGFVASRKSPFAETAKNGALTLAGIAILVVGARLLLDGAVGLAREFGVSERVIGLTLVAAGTSLPEVATSVMATIRKELDIAVANVVGSNIFNILFILGFAASISPFHASPAILAKDMPWALGSAAILWPMFVTGRRLSRGEGAALLGAYGVYVWLLTGVAA